jgi:NO-binding membrane sensor protein with MHYT domain
MVIRRSKCQPLQGGICLALPGLPVFPSRAGCQSPSVREVVPMSSLMVSHYDMRLVALSVIIALIASYAAPDLAGRVAAARGNPRVVWLTGGATAMGLGIWSTHYIGMLAFHLPVPVIYDHPTVLASLLAAVFASAVALWVVSRHKWGWPRRSPPAW